MSKTKLIIIIIVVVVLSGAAVWFFGFYQSDKSYKSDKTYASDQPGQSDLPQTYTHPNLGFSFSYPEGFSVQSFEEEAGETILVEKSASDQRTDQRAISGFQIFISEFDEPGPISKERIRLDIPDMVIEQPQEVGLPAGSPTSTSVRALIFFSQDESFGKTREVWFIWPENPQPNGNYLYQITSSLESAGELSEILGTWKFIQ